MSPTELLNQLVRLPRLRVRHGYRLVTTKCPFHDCKLLVDVTWAGWPYRTTVPFGLN